MIDMSNAPIARSFLTDSKSENEGEIRPSPIILPLSLHPLAPDQEQLQDCASAR